MYDSLICASYTDGIVQTNLWFISEKALCTSMIQNDSSYLDPPETGCQIWMGVFGALAGGSEDTSPAFNTGSPTGGEAEEDSPPKQPKPEVEVAPGWNGKDPFSQDSAIRYLCF